MWGEVSWAVLPGFSWAWRRRDVSKSAGWISRGPKSHNIPGSKENPLMGVASTFLVAHLGEAAKLLDTATHAAYPLYECRNVNEDDIDDLTEALEEQGLAKHLDFGAELLEVEDEDTGPWVHRIDPALADALSSLEGATLLSVARGWAAATLRRVKQTEEPPSAAEVEDYESLLRELSGIARQARGQRDVKLDLLLWVSH
jgi:hypothetical protein